MDCCKPKVAQPDPIAKLSDLKESLDAKLLSKHYELQEILLRAKQFRKNNDQERAKAEFKRYKMKNATYTRYVATYSNVCAIWDEIESLHDFVDIAGGLKGAEGVMERLLKRHNVQDLDRLMDGLEQQLMDAEEIGMALAGPEQPEVDLSELDQAMLDDIPAVPIGTQVGPIGTQVGPIQQKAKQLA